MECYIGVPRGTWILCLLTGLGSEVMGLDLAKVRTERLHNALVSDRRGFPWHFGYLEAPSHEALGVEKNLGLSFGHGSRQFRPQCGRRSP